MARSNVIALLERLLERRLTLILQALLMADVLWSELGHGHDSL